MEDSDNPYSILGVPTDASKQEIKAAYRKLAFLHHPDKASDKVKANEAFAKIANAYELLSDPKQRHEFDREQQQQPPGPYQDNHHDLFAQFRRASAFHDPFTVFESVFREEFGQPTSSFGGDPFFGNSMFGRGGAMFGGGGLFGNSNSLFGGGGGSLFGRDPFAGSMVNDPYGPDDRFNSLFSAMRQQQADAYRQGSYSFTSTSTSSTSFGGGAGMNHGETVTTQTTTRNVNGQMETVTERIVRRADGTVTREVLPSQHPSHLLDGSASKAPRLSNHHEAKRRRRNREEKQDRA